MSAPEHIVILDVKTVGKERKADDLEVCSLSWFQDSFKMASPILNRQAPVGAGVAQWLPLNSAGSAKATWASLGEGDICPEVFGVFIGS